MARPNFTTRIRANTTNAYFVGGPKTQVCTDARFAQEIVVGLPRSKRPGGWLPPKPYSLTRNVYARHNGSVFLKSTFLPSGAVYPSTDVIGIVGGAPTAAFNSLNTFDECCAVEGVNPDLVQRALINARSKLKAQDVNLGVAWAESNKTAEHLLDTAKTLANSYRRLRRGDVRGAARALGITKDPKVVTKTVASRWLELQYGWKPLLADVHGSAEALANSAHSDWRVTAVGMAKEDIEESKGLVDPPSRPDYGFGSARGWRGAHCRIDALPSNDLLASFKSLGITNPLEIAWELVPFSFVIDWALPIGDYLNSLDALLGFESAWYCESQMETFRVQHSLSDNSYVEGDYLFEGRRSGSGYRKYTRLVRTVSASVPLPDFPGLKNPVSAGHVANAMALLVSVFQNAR